MKSTDYRNYLRGLPSYLRRKGLDTDILSQASSYRSALRRALMLARSSLPSESFEAFFADLNALTLAERNELRRVPIGSDFLNGIITGSRIPIEDEIAWMAARLKSNSESINAFLRLSSQLEAAVWSGDLTKALECLAKIEQDHGMSVWQLAIRIALEQQIGGIEAQKEYVSSLRRQFKGGIIPFFAYHISIRNEPNVSWSWYVEDTRRRLDQSSLGSRLKPYFRYHFLKQWPHSDSEIQSILQVEQCHSEVDVYETFVSLAQHAASTQTSTTIVAAIKLALAKLTSIDDERLTKAGQYLGVFPLPQLEMQSSAANALLQGEAAAAYALAIRALRFDPTSSDHALVAAFARSARLSRQLPSRIAGLPSLWSSVILDLVRVFRRSSQYNEALDRLRKSACNLGATRPARALCGILASESSTEMLMPLSELRMVGLNMSRHTFCDVRAGVMVPGEECDLAGAYFSSMHKRVPVPSAIDASGHAYALAIASARDQDWTGAAAKASEVRSTKHRALQRRATLFEAHARVRLEQVGPVVSLIETEIANNGTLIDLFPSVELVDGRSWSDLRGAADQLGLAICLDLALKASASDKIATHRRFAYDAFLHSQSVERASELDISLYERRALVYFLSNVAVFSVLDMSDALESTKDIQEERRRILSLLITLDPESASEYQDEILDITDQLSLAEGIRIVDSSRIHVDIDAIEAWAQRELSDGYRRYRTLVDTGIGVADDFDLVLTKIRKGDEKTKTLFAIPVNEADDLLISLTAQLLERFLYDPAHGLDSYLSRRIRHGSIVGFLRGPVEAARLVSLRDETDATYAPNLYWLEQLEELKQDERDLISRYLINFAKAYDDALIRLRDELIQIHDKDHPSGLIDMRLYAEVFHLIRSSVKEDDSFSLFVASCFAAFWGLLDRYLSACRNEITGNLRAALGSAFDTLRGRVTELYAGATTDSSAELSIHRRGLAELNGAITSAQNDLQAALEDVQTWFARSETQLATRVYPLNEAVNIAVQSARARLRSYNPEIEIRCEDGVEVPAEDLSVIAEIVLVTLTNACEHSGGDRDAYVEVEIGRLEDGRQLAFKVRNPVDESKRTSNDRRLVDAIRAEIATGAATPAVRKDRRSGLRKLGALKMRFPVANLEFGFTNDNNFRVEFVVPFNSIKSPALKIEEHGHVDSSS